MMMIHVSDTSLQSLHMKHCGRHITCYNHLTCITEHLAEMRANVGSFVHTLNTQCNQQAVQITCYYRTHVTLSKKGYNRKKIPYMMAKSCFIAHRSHTQGHLSLAPGARSLHQLRVPLVLALG